MTIEFKPMPGYDQASRNVPGDVTASDPDGTYIDDTTDKDHVRIVVKGLASASTEEYAQAVSERLGRIYIPKSYTINEAGFLVVIVESNDP